jgi:hypothetical protein
VVDDRQPHFGGQLRHQTPVQSISTMASVMQR